MSDAMMRATSVLQTDLDLGDEIVRILLWRTTMALINVLRYHSSV